MRKKQFLGAVLLLFLLVADKTFSQISYSYTGSLNNERWLHESQLLPNGNILCFGGNNGVFSNLVTYKSGEIYNYTTGNWSSAMDMKEARYSFASAILPNGNIIAIGGQNASSFALATCEIYNSSTGAWSSTASMNYPRRGHKALQLADGRILVAGGSDNTTEIFDPATNTWSYTGLLNKLHDDGLSMVLLNSGNVLLTGGYANRNIAEIYNPATGVWMLLSDRMQANRYYHNSVLLNNGKVLISGGGPNDALLTSELFDPLTSTFSYTGSLVQSIGNCKTLVLDDGKVLLYGIGDLFSPVDTKFLQLYSPTTGEWQKAGTYAVTGVNDYTINKLNNGKLLIAGGNVTTGNGASEVCILITQDAFSGCVAPNISLTASGTALCYGKQAVVTISATESGVSYAAYINNNIVSAVQAGGGNISIPITSQLRPGVNVVKISTQKAGCAALYLSDTARINVIQSNTEIPAIIATGPLTFCSSARVTLKHAANANSYLWSTGETTDSISVNDQGYYFIYFRDANGCLSYPSNSLFVEELPFSNVADAGPDMEICPYTVQLVGKPVKGVWSGKSVSASGLFSGIEAGVYHLAYTYCGNNDSMTVTVKPRAVVPDYVLNTAKTVCYESQPIVHINNTNINVQYELYLNGIKYGDSKQGGTDLVWGLSFIYAPAHLMVIAKAGNSCGTVERIKYDTISLYPDSKNNLTIISDTVCNNDTSRITIFNSEAGIRYVAYQDGFFKSPLTDTATGNNGTINFPLLWPNANITLAIKAISKQGCFTMMKNKPTTIARNMSVDFKLSSYQGFIGDTISFTNSSNTNTYNWNIDGKISTKINPDPVTFTSLGLKTITLIGNNPHIRGCSDTITRIIEISSPTPSAGGNVCQYDTLQSTSSTERWTYAFHVDKEGNSYLATNSYFEPLNHDIYNGSYGLSLNKYDKNGKLLWSKQHNPLIGSQHYDKFYSNFVIAIKTDNANNIYIAGSFAGDSWDWDTMHIKYNKPRVTPYIVKLNPAGIVQWYITSDNNSLNETGFTDMIYVDDNNIYASLFKPDNIIFPFNNIVSKFRGTNFAIIKINKDGKFLNGYANSIHDNQMLYTLVSANTFYMFGRMACLSPKISLTSKGKIIVSGKSSNTLKFGNITIGKVGMCNGFIALLDMVNGWESVFTTFSFKDTYLYDYIRPVQPHAVDGNDNVYVTETVTNDMTDLTQGITVYFNNTDSFKLKEGNFVVKYDLNGKLQWYNNNTLIYPKGLIVLPEEILLYGQYTDFCTLNSQSAPSRLGLKSKGKYDAMLASFDRNGKINWMETIGSNAADFSYFITKDICDDKVYLSGITNSKTSFKTNKLDLPFSRSFIAKYSGNGICSSQNCPDCYGVKNGTAFIDSCKKCAGGTTGLVPVLDPRLCGNSAIKDNSVLSTILIYPNPSQGQLYVKSQEPVKYVAISNIVGDVVFTAEHFTDNKNIILDIAVLPPAAYFIRIKLNNAEYNTKVLIIK